MDFAEFSSGTLHETFNYAEAVFWGLIGSILLANFLRSRKPLLLTAGLLFLAFAVSDLVEVQTGAWWRPLPLLIAKGTIVIGLLACLHAHLRGRK